MNHPDPQRKNTVQNVLIVLLSVSAVLMFIRTQILFRENGNRYLTDLFSAQAPTWESSVPTELTEISAPVQLAATGAYGLYGNLRLSTTDESFTQPGSLLRMALGSAGSSEKCSESEFRAALTGTSLYFDFKTPLPLSVIGGFVGADLSSSVLSQRLALVSEAGNVILYSTQGTDFFRCATHVSAEDLAQIVNSYQLGNASFAYELDENTVQDPYSLLQTDSLPSYPVLSASSHTEDDKSAILSALGYNPRTNSRYADGSTEVVLDGDRTVRLSADGDIVYQGGGSASTVQIASGDDVPTARESVIGVYQLLSGMLDTQNSEANLCLSGMTLSGDSWTLNFSYQSGGTKILRGDGSPAAQVVLSGKNVKTLRFFPRRYSATEEESLLLPLTQAMAIASAYDGADLEICYTDNGGGSISAGWIAE
ncbi:MAG: hypothetical protein LKJ86_02755 [Oscillibacter sp.]|jgi:hypothetical protein|nr:hypothetical protein [Oscillibacter sp.]